MVNTYSRAVRARRLNEARAIVVPHERPVNFQRTTIRSGAFVRSVELGCEREEKREGGRCTCTGGVFISRTMPGRVMRQSERQTAKSFANVWFVNYYSYQGETKSPIILLNASENEIYSRVEGTYVKMRCLSKASEYFRIFFLR